jgi:hypothetical protein
MTKINGDEKFFDFDGKLVSAILVDCSFLRT